MEKNKKIISMSLDKDLVDRINAATMKSGINSRSSYVEAILDRHLTREEVSQDGKEEESAIIPEN